MSTTWRDWPISSSRCESGSIMQSSSNFPLKQEKKILILIKKYNYCYNYCCFMLLQTFWINKTFPLSEPHTGLGVKFSQAERVFLMRISSVVD